MNKEWLLDEMEDIRRDENLTLAQKNKALHELEMEYDCEYGQRQGENLNE